MKLQHAYLRSFALGLGALLSASGTFLISFSAYAQSFPNDSLNNTVTTSTQYLVYLPNKANLQQAKAIAPDAFVSQLDTGEQVVQLGRFNNLNLAQRRASQFTQMGLNAQIKTVQTKFATYPNTPPTVSSSESISVAPIPVESVPIPTSRVNEPLPNVPDSSPNSIEIVRSPQTLPQPTNQAQPIPIQPIPQTLPSVTAQPTSNTSADQALRYFVIIPTSSSNELQRVQAIAPTAQFRSSQRGTYIEIQGYPDRASAEALNITIRRQGFDSRVVYF